jgi:hypothetical protein
MKTSINSNYIRSIFQSVNFSKRINKILPNTIKSIDIYDIGMSRASGYGQYYNYIKFSIDGEEIISYERRHTNSPSWDYFKELEFGTTKCSNFMKQFVIDMLEYYFKENNK